MSTDRRRITGPTDAKTPQIGISSGTPATAKKPVPQQPRGLRKFFLKSGLTKNANGLAYLEVGNTILEVSVYGPRPIRGFFIDRASFSVECKFLPYLTQPNEVIFNASDKRNVRSGLTHIEHRISTYVETALLPSICVEKYPKLTIDVFINVIAFDPTTGTLPNLISWAVNCAGLAMVDSGIEVKDMVTAGHAKVSGGEITMDLQLDENDQNSGTECVASFMKMQGNEMVAFWVESSGAEEVEESRLKLLLDGCDEMSTEVRKNLNGYLLKIAREAEQEETEIEGEADAEMSEA